MFQSGRCRVAVGRRFPSGILGPALCARTGFAGRVTRKRKGMITIRWALWFSLLLVMVFAVSISYHLGIEYAEQFIEQ